MIAGTHTNPMVAPLAEPTAVDETNVLAISTHEHQHSATPIEKLHQDILWANFLMNTNMEEDREKPRPYDDDQGPEYRDFRALSVLRRSSQVCHLWRDIILSAAGLWGRVIDLHLLTLGTSDWREEDLRRSGHALLWVKGDVDGSDETSSNFFVELLHNHGSRIRDLNANIGHVDRFPTSTWDIMSRPTRPTKSFKFRFVDLTHNRFDLPFFLTTEREGMECENVFENISTLISSAPLNEIKFDCPSVSQSLQAPWFSHISTLGLGWYAESHPTLRWAVSEIVGLLMRMPLLENLDLRHCFIAPNNYRVPPSKRCVHSGLRQLWLHDSMATLDAFLEHMDPTPTLSVRLIVDTDSRNRASEAYDFHSHLSILRFAKAFYKLSGSPVSLEIESSSFQLSALQEDGNWYSFRVLYPYMIKETDYTLRFALFSGCDFTKLKGLIFDACQAFDFDLHPHISYSGTTPLFRALSSVETLETNVETLTFFTKLCGEESLFPVLHTINLQSHHITACELEDSQVEDYATIIHCFLAMREEEGHPIRELHVLRTGMFPESLFWALHIHHPNIEMHVYVDP